MNDTFDKLSNEFNTPAIQEPEKQIQVFEQQKKDLVEKTTQIRTLEDKTFLQTEIKSLIENSKKVLETVQKDIKIGTAPRTIEVYAKLLSSVIEGIKELRELNQAIANMTMFRDPEEIPKASVNIKMTAKELMQMMKDAKETSQIKAVEAKFSVEGEPKDDTNIGK